ncbi:ABC transporter permease [Roseivirga sp.]|uniref:ABC transporter permease n=1 Tax=Roseivirga sp. TaxID=1964215 RepID=UPI003B52021B
MIKNYLKVAFRNIKRNKLYATLNILGLSVGLASFFVIILFLNNELSYDKFHEKADQVYRVVLTETYDGQSEKVGGLTAALAPASAEEIPEIMAYSRIEGWNKSVIIPGSQADSSAVFNSLAVEDGFFEFFDLEILSGNEGLADQNAILMSQAAAELHFGSNQAAIGKTIKYRGNSFRVTGVFKNLPETNSLKADMIGSYKGLNSWRSEDSFSSWNSSYFDQTYFLLTPGALVSDVQAKLNELFEKNAVAEQKELSLQPLTDVHFALDVSDSINSQTDRQYILIFTAVAIFILCCALFNYVSLSLSQSLERLKEVGVRRVVGAGKAQLFFQFIAESMIYVLMAYILAVVLVEVTVPQLEILLDRQLEVNLTARPDLLVFSLLFSLLLSVISGVYPAWLSSKVNAVTTLKGGTGRFKSQKFINGITVFQLMVFMVLVSVTFTANKQMRFMQNENLGFDNENQVVIQMFSEPASKNGDVFKNELFSNPYIKSASFTTSVPTRVMGLQRFNNYDFNFFNFDVDEDYLKTLDMDLLAGRSFTAEDKGNKEIVMINETAAQKMFGDEEAVGKVIDTGNSKLRIVGVVSDFHFLSKKQPIEPTLFKPLEETFGVIIVKLTGENLIETVDYIKSTYAGLTDGEEMRYFFLQDQINSQYKQENLMISMINSMTIIAAFVALLGLFGMSGYAAKRRLKEMGIRKVLGAGFISIQKTLNITNLWKLLLAGLLGVPVIYYWMDNWLSSFAYRIELPLFLIGTALGLASLVVLLTTAFHSIRAYLINPVDILKDE